MAAERPESSTPCEQSLDQSHEGPQAPIQASSPRPYTTQAEGGGGGTCKYVLKMCLAERVMSSPMPIFYEGSKREILAPGLQPGPTVSRPSLSTTHVDVVQLVSGRAPEH